MTVFVLEYLRGKPIAVTVNGTPKKLSPLQRSLVAALAEADGRFLSREALAERLQLDHQGLYRLVYATRRRLGDLDLIDQVGSCTTRNGRSFGLSGYRLAGTVTFVSA